MNNLCQHRFSHSFSARDYVSGENFEVESCDNCGLLKTLIESDPVSDDDYYPQEYYGKEKRYNKWLTHLLNVLIRFRTRGINLSSSGAVLDVGCGQGWFLNYFRDKGWHTTGVEVSNQAAYHAREVLNIDVKIGTKAIETIESNQFDLVVLWHVLEHVADDERLLQEIKRVMKDDADLLIGVPNAGSPEAKFCTRDWFHLDVPRHIKHYSLENINALLANLGMQINKTSYYVPEYDFFSFVQSIQNKMRLPQNRLYQMIRTGSLGESKTGISNILCNVAVVLTAPILVLLALIWVPLAAILKKGSSMTLLVRKNVK